MSVGRRSGLALDRAGLLPAALKLSETLVAHEVENGAGGASGPCSPVGGTVDEVVKKTASSEPADPPPWAPPPSSPVPPPPPFTVHGVGAVTLASVLGGPVGGSILLAINEHRWGRPAVARNYVVGSVVGTGALVALSFLLPDAFGRALGPASIFGMRALAQQVQGPRLVAHERVGGKFASLWNAVGVGLATLLVLVAVLAAVVFSLPDGLGPRIHVGTGEVCFTEGATEADARTVAKCLEPVGFFRGDSRQVQLKRRSGVLAVRFFLNDDACKDPEILRSFGSLRRDVLAKAFEGLVEVELCDHDGAAKGVLR